VSRYPTIPDFDETPESIANAVRAIKDVVEQLAALRQGEAISPKVFWQGDPPEPVKNQLRGGDLWANPENNKLHHWHPGAGVWVEFA
jgi:hypothetical protein